MKKIWIFLGGILTGFILSFVIFILIGIGVNNSNSQGIPGATFFEQPGKTITASPLEIFQVLDKGIALANVKSIGLGMTVLIYDPEQLFYDDQVIYPEQGNTFKEIGRYQYTTRSDFEKTIPIVVEM